MAELSRSDLEDINTRIIEEVRFIGDRYGEAGQYFEEDTSRDRGACTRLLEHSAAVVAFRLEDRDPLPFDKIVSTAVTMTVGDSFYNYAKKNRLLEALSRSEEDSFEALSRDFRDELAAMDRARPRRDERRDRFDRGGSSARSNDGGGDRFLRRQQRGDDVSNVRAPSQPAGPRRAPRAERTEDDTVRRPRGQAPMGDVRRTEPESVPAVEDGQIITTSNIKGAVTSKVLAPIYLMGTQVTVKADNQLIVKPAEEDMDYERHRTDRMLAPRVSGKPSQAQTTDAIDAALDACRRKVNAWVTTPATEEGGEATVGPATINQSAQFIEPLAVVGMPSDYACIRQTLREEGLVTPAALLKNALVVDVRTRMPHMVSNDVIEQLKIVPEHDKTKMLVALLLSLRSDLHPEAWASLHDRLTRNIEELFLTNMGITISMSSIVLDWDDLAGFLNKQGDAGSNTLFNRFVPFLAKTVFDFDQTDEGNFLANDERILFLPISSSELSFASARKYGHVKKEDNPKLWQLLNDLSPQLDRKTSIVTLDSHRLGVLTSPTTIDETMFFLGPKA